MRILKIFLITVFIFLLILTSLWFSRCWILTTLTRFYFGKYDVSLEMTIEELSTRRLLIRDIVIDGQNRIEHVDLTYSLFEKHLQQVDVHISQLDAPSLARIVQKMQSTKNNSTTKPVSFSEAHVLCQKILEPALKIEIAEVKIDQKTLKPNLSLQKKNKELHLHWKDLYSTGELHLSCKENQLSLVAPKLTLNMKDFNWNSMHINTIDIDASRAFLNWSATSPLQFAFPGHLSLSLEKDKKKWQLHVPQFVLSGYSTTSDLKEVMTHGLLKYVKLEKNMTLAFDSLDFSQTINLSNPSLKSVGEFQFRNISLKTKKDLFKGVHILGNSQWNGTEYHLSLDLKDQTKELNISHLKIDGHLQNEKHTLQLAPKRSLIKFNAQIMEWFPILKESVKSMSGLLQLQGQLTYSKQKIHGQIHLIGQKISGETEYGNFENLTFSHMIDSFEHYSSPPQQVLTVDKIMIGPGITNFKAVYRISELQRIKVDELIFNFEEAQVMSRNFILNSVNKRVENFSAVIHNLSLEKTLAIGLKNTVTAKGRLQGHLNLDYAGKRPVVSGLLATASPGWIQHRTGKPQGQLSISDGPMDILNNYLYNFHYTTLSLTISSDVDYNMHMKLGTFGHNPDYLNGKPLKLNVNLQQNLLAAMQSMMLTYDLPSKIKERFEKVDP